MQNRTSLGLFSVCLLASNLVLADSHFETPGVYRAPQILPPSIVSGPNHTIQQQVTNDGFLNIYTLNSKYGPLRAVSTATLFKRINELNAMAAMEELEGTEEFQKNMAEKAGDFVEGGAMVIKDPVGAVSGAVSGVAGIFRSVGNTLEYGQSDTESSRLSVISGYAKTRRDYAAAFNVDLYSRNKYLQDKLTEISRGGFLGTSLVRIGTAAVGGGAGAALSITGNVEALNELLRTKTAGDLRGLMEEKLEAMAVADDTIEIFLENRAYTLTQQVAMVLALESMDGTLNRAAFIKFAAMNDNEDMAAFRRRQAEMYESYHRNVAPVAAFEFLEQVACARKKDGGIVFSAPLDHMLWTEDLAPFVQWIDSRVDALENVKSKELQVGGTVSAMTRKNFQQMGWKLVENSLTAIAAK